jgi:hypothetical protein
MVTDRFFEKLFKNPLTTTTSSAIMGNVSRGNDGKPHR